MQKTIFFVMAALFISVVPNFSEASFVGSYNINWGYTPDWDPAVTGFKVYCNKIEVGFISGAHAEGGDVVFLVDQKFGSSLSFTVTATFKNGTESEHSSPLVIGIASSKGLSAPIDFRLGKMNWGRLFFPI